MRIVRKEIIHITPTEDDAIARVRSLLNNIEDSTEMASIAEACSDINCLFDDLMEKVEVDE